MMRQSGKWTTVSKDPHLKNAASASRHDSQETTSLNEDIECCSVPEDRTSPTPPSQLLAPTSQCDIDCIFHIIYSMCCFQFVETPFMMGHF